MPADLTPTQRAVLWVLHVLGAVLVVLGAML